MANGHALEFLLVPDGAAARRVRRALATGRARSGILVGTFPELLGRAQLAYFVTGQEESAGDFHSCMEAVRGAFWTGSLEAAPEETSDAVSRAMVDLLSESDPAHGLHSIDASGLPERPRRRVGDLGRLADLVRDRLPGQLGAIQALLRAPSSGAAHPIRVRHVEGLPRTTRWQQALIGKLNRDAESQSRGQASGSALLSMLRDCLDPQPRARPQTVLRTLQDHIYAPGAASASPDDSALWIQVRDFYQEAEVVAGMAQTLLDQSPGLSPSAIGLLVPDDFAYGVALEDSFRLAGIPLSGLAVERWRRDLGREVVFHFLFCRQKPAPAMALAVCLSSVLMPWSAEDGAVLAQKVMDKRYQLKPPRGSGEQGARMLKLLEEGDAEPATLARALKEFKEALDGGESFAFHARNAEEAVDRVLAKLPATAPIDWTELRRAVTPEDLRTGEGPAYNLEGVTVWNENREPWRDVRHLFVLGFAQGHYPRITPVSPVFAEDEVAAIRQGLGLSLPTQAERGDGLRALFRRQLRAASDSVTFLVPHRSPTGVRQDPSDSLVFMSRLVRGCREGADLVATLDAAEDREKRMRLLATAAPSKPRPARELGRSDLSFGRDLLALKRDSAGNVAPQSPSSLELPLVSPLAWLLKSLDALPLLWEPESDSPLVLGTLAHAVFEELFGPTARLPSDGDLEDRVTRVLDDVAKRVAPFLRGPQWRAERRNLAKQAAKSAAQWKRILGELGATILANEQWLEGQWGGIRIHGMADLILGVGDRNLLMVDYKWSKSPSRRKRMELGYEIQATLYREMAITGGLKAGRQGGLNGSRELAARLRQASRVGIAYYTMKDHTCLSDADPPVSGSIRGWDSVEGDVARNATDVIKEHLDELRKGEVRLNTERDRERAGKKLALPTFAFDASPLVELFAHRWLLEEI